MAEIRPSRPRAKKSSNRKSKHKGRGGEDGEGGHGVPSDPGVGPVHGTAAQAGRRPGGLVVVRVGAARPLHQGAQQHQVMSEAQGY